MSGPRIGVIGTGEMGSGIGGMLAANGGNVATTLAGRSGASAARVNATAMTVVPDLATLVRESDIVLSIVPPDRALGVAEDVVAALGGATPAPVFVDCNAIAPVTVARLAGVLAVAGVPFVDAGIVGGAPKPGYDGPHLYASGADLAPFEALSAFGLHVKPLAGPAGQASALKMCYAGISKGLAGIGDAMFKAAERAGIGEAFMAEFIESQPELYPWLKRQIAAIDRKAYRWVGEMREIATFTADAPGVPVIYEGFAQEYEAIAEAMKAKTSG
jgi:L-threonate 2-dehydrogenase